MNAPVETKKKSNGCLKGCLIALGVVLILGAVVVLVLVSQGRRIARWGVDRLTGGGVGIEAPAGYRAVPIPLGAGFAGARSSTFLGAGSPADVRGHFLQRLEQEGWSPLQDGEKPVEAFSFVSAALRDESDAAMTMDFLQKEGEVLVLYVGGSKDGTIAALVAIPENRVRSQP